jgi:hypothetical protein
MKMRGVRPRVVVVAMVGAAMLLASCGSDGSDGSSSSGTPSTAAGSMKVAASGSDAVFSSSDTPPTGTSVLGVVNAAGGTFEDGKLTLTGVQPTGTWFSDRPSRVAGTNPMEQFLDIFFGTDDPPNAAIDLSGEPEGSDLAIVELSDPSYDATSGELTMSAKVIEPEQIDGARLVTHRHLDRFLQRNDAAIPASFGANALFIDNASDVLTPVQVTFPNAQDVADFAAKVATTQTGLNQLLDELRTQIEENAKAPCFRWLEQNVAQVMYGLETVTVPAVRQLQQEVAANGNNLPASDADEYNSAVAYFQTIQTGYEEGVQFIQSCRENPNMGG